MSDSIRWDLAANGVLTITINRPEVKNALDPQAQNGLVKAVVDAARHPEVRVVVVTGAGASFCTGADVRVFGAPDPDDAIAQQYSEHERWTSLEGRADRLRQLSRMTLLLHKMGKPTIAKLRGPAAGMGFSIALACDFRIASDNAFLITSFANIGTSGDFGGSFFLTQLVGPSRAKEIYMFSDRVPAAECLSLGLVNKVVPDAELDAAVDAYAARLAAGPILAYRYMKDNVNAACSQTLEQVLDIESTGMMRSRLSDDCKEALIAFQEKRKPTFKGR